MSSRKVMIIRLIAGQIEKHYHAKWVSIQNQIFIEKKRKVKLELPNYATKSKAKKTKMLIN